MRVEAVLPLGNRVEPLRDKHAMCVLRIHYRCVIEECVREGKLEYKLETARHIANAMKVGDLHEFLWHAYGGWWKKNRSATFCDFFKQYDLCDFNALLCKAKKPVH